MLPITNIGNAEMNTPETCKIIKTKPLSVHQQTEAKVLQIMCCSAGKALTTRELSDRCDISIYAARNWLLRLAKDGKVYCEHKNKKTTLWHFKPHLRPCQKPTVAE